MTDKELETTGLFGTIRNHDDLDIGEQLEELEERLEYVDLTDNEREDFEERIERIREEEDLNTKEELFNDLIKELDN